MTRLPSLPLATLAGEMLRAEEGDRRGTWFVHRSGTVGGMSGTALRTMVKSYATALGLDAWRIDGAIADVARVPLT